MNDPLAHDFYLVYAGSHSLSCPIRTRLWWVRMKELGRLGYRVGPGTIYPLLYRLEQKRHLISFDQ